MVEILLQINQLSFYATIWPSIIIEGAPDKTMDKKVAQHCLENRLLMLTCGPWDNTIRWMPPLMVSDLQIDQARNFFTSALKAV